MKPGCACVATVAWKCSATSPARSPLSACAGDVHKAALNASEATARQVEAGTPSEFYSEDDGGMAR